MKRTLIFFAVMCCIVASPAGEECIYNLTDSNFAVQLRTPNKVWFVKFFAPWCGYCKKIQPAWIELANEYCTDEKIRIAQVDAYSFFPIIELYRTR